VGREEGPDVKKLVPRNDLAQSWPEQVHDSLRSRVWFQDQNENESRRPTHSGYVTEHEIGFGQSPKSAQGRPKRVNSVGAYRRVRLRNHEVCGEADVEILPRHAPPGREWEALLLLQEAGQERVYKRPPGLKASRASVSV
jgi:hypothetical protein